MPKIYNGVIPFGSGDESVLFECSQKSQADIDAANGTLQAGATITDAGVVVGAAGGVQFDMTGLTSTIQTAIKAQLPFTCQISFTVNALAIGTPNAEYAEAIGVSPPAYWLHMNSVDGGAAPYTRIYSSGGALAVSAQLSTTDSESNKTALHEAIGGDAGLITITASGNGKSSKLIANGVILHENDRNIFESGIAEYLMSGAFLTGLYPVEGAVMSDVIVSSRPVQYATHPMLSNVCWYGDSYVDQQDNDVLFFKAGCINSFEAYFRRLGFKCNGIEAGVSGALVIDSATGNVLSQLQGTSVKPNLGLADLDPRIVCFRDFVNDVITATDPDLDQSIADRKGHIQMVLDRNPKNHVIVGTVPSQALNPTYDNDHIVARIDYVNPLILGLPDAMTAINPAYAGRVHVADQAKAFGGHNPTVKVYQQGNNHPNGFGQWLQGELYAKVAHELLG